MSLDKQRACSKLRFTSFSGDTSKRDLELLVAKLISREDFKVDLVQRDVTDEKNNVIRKISVAAYVWFKYYEDCQFVQRSLDNTGFNYMILHVNHCTYTPFKKPVSVVQKPLESLT